MTWGKENEAESRTATDAEGRFRLKVPPFGRRIINGIYQLAYRPGMTITGSSIFRAPDHYVLRKPEPRTVRVEGPDGRPIAGVRIVPRVLDFFNSATAEIPESMARTPGHHHGTGRPGDDQLLDGPGSARRRGSRPDRSVPRTSGSSINRGGARSSR